jgi:hypothetical protein
VVREQRSRALLPTGASIALLASFVALGVIAVLAYQALATRSEAADAVAHTRQVQGEDSVTSSTYVALGGVTVLIAMLLLVGYLASRDYRTVADDNWVRRVQLASAGELRGDLRRESLADKLLHTVVANLGRHPRDRDR